MRRLKSPPENVFLASAAFARESCTNLAIKALYSGENNAAAIYEDLGWLVSLVETDITFGITSELEVEPVMEAAR